MRHFLALPALLRPTIFLAYASQHAFSVQDDLLAFPQFEVKFLEQYVPELQARAKLRDNIKVGAAEPTDAPSQIEQYHSPTTHDSRSEGRNNEEPNLEYEYMMLDGQRYLCSIPPIKKREDPSASSNDTLNKEEEEKELARATDRGWELLSSMQGNCVYFVSGWWSYRFCYGQGVKQFHQLPPSRGVPVYPPMEDPTVEGYHLGTYDKKVDDDETVSEAQTDTMEREKGLDIGTAAKSRGAGYGELVQRGESRYLVQRLDGGTKCDLTGKDRKIEVQFHCNPQSSDRISLIKETATCAYLMVVQTPRLCNDVAFLPPQKDAPHAVRCSPIMAEDEVEDYEREIKALKSAEKESKSWEANADVAAAMRGEEGRDTHIQIVGDIVVGGHDLVPEGVKLEKSAIVGGGKETYIDTVASSDGRILSEEDIKRLGLGDARAVEKLRKELEKIAQGQNWKLDIIDTPRGREYRGIIGDDEEEKKEKQEKKDSEEGPGENGSQEEYYKEEL